ncbi:MAG: ABC transporter [Catenulispora sp. 13_1_20CM_3_70_7]|jgi:ABC-2 type transport system ATP-binding protein|nr:ABC transporter ATP-binding protein [Catenulisporales bacterium]OLE28732.1 MAG: ABC transporter [Catenulispora sp. 13_1_20CM_3_70_7]
MTTATTSTAGAAVPASASAAVIEASGLTKRYSGATRGAVTALDGLTLSVPAGVIGLVGANGAGKSTLIKILLGLLAPSSGSAAVLGYDVVDQAERIRTLVGYMPEHDCLPPDVTATEFVTHMGRMDGLPPTAAKERAAESLRHVGLHEERYRLIGTYSTGMKQRVKLAQALVGDPRLMLLDEPTNGLDPAGREAMLDLIERIGSEFGISILVASHLLGEIEQICDSLVAIDSGKLLRAASMAAFTKASAVVAVEVDEGTAELGAALRAAGLSPARDGRALLVRLGATDAEADKVYDAIRDAVADLGLPLNRLERRRHRVEELFADESFELDDRIDIGTEDFEPRGNETGAASTTGTATGSETDDEH